MSLGYFRVDISPAIAQLLPDNTLGEENSVVTPNINIKGIEGDRIDGGAKRGTNLFHSFQEFNIQQGGQVYFSNPDGVTNILTRVTGDNTSNILGTLGVDGKADLFFINPKGIIFGSEAKLDVQGSFYGSTADSILFNKGFEFTTSDPQAPPLLTVNVPIGLRLPENPGSIQVEGRGHNINMSKYIRSFTDEGKENRNLGLKVSQGQILGLVGGDIFFRGGNLTSLGGRVELGSVQNGAVRITTDGTLSYDQNLKFGQILLSEESSIDVSGNGRVEFQIRGEQIKVQDNSIITGQSSGDKDGGTSIIKASESIKVEATKPLENNISLTLNIGGIGGTTRSFKKIPSIIIVNTFGKGDVGELTVEAESLTLQDALISTTTFGQGNAGNLMVSARDIEIIGGGDFDLTGLLAVTIGKGNGGKLTVEVAESLTLGNGALISTSTLGQGNAGDLKISARNIEMDNSGLLARVRGNIATGAAGNITIYTESLNLRNQAQIAVSSTTQKPPGDLIINSNNIRIENKAQLKAETTAGDQGSITINNNKDFILRKNSNITTNATGEATGGNITINTENLVALENSDISANAQAGKGGMVKINTSGIFGTEFRPEQTDKSEITATSKLGPSLNGEVKLNTPDVDPSEALVEFEETIQDISSLINQNPCRQGQNSQFTITGKSGLPPNLTDPLIPNYLWQDPETSTTPPATISSSEEEFIEAQGWISNSQGIELITNPKTATPTPPWLIPHNCEQLDSAQPRPDLLASSKGTIPTSNSEALKVTIKQFNFEGNTKFSNQELQQQLTSYINKPITFAQLIAARTAITKYYTKNNYITSGAFIPPQTISDNGTLTLQVVEGKVGEINVNIQGRLNQNYIKSRLEKATTAPLNQEKLLSALQLLQIDPLVKTISAELSSGVRPDTSILDIEIETANPWQIVTISNNGKAPSVGTFRRGIEVGHRNITGIGDSLNALYTHTDGSDTVEVSYSIPVNSNNSRIELFYRHRDIMVVESPFERLDLESNSNTYKLSFSQPIMQTPWQSLTLGLSAVRRDSQTSILGQNYPLSEGADDNGETKLSILQFFQNYELRGKNQVLAFNSRFNLGLGILDATKNSNEPDSRFFYWRGQGQWVRELAKNTLLVLGVDIQLSPSDLVPRERFALGGYRSVRAYRQDTRLTDNGALGTVELRLPIPWISGKNRLFQVVPFIDGGVVWNSDGEEVEGSNNLAAAGVGLQVSLWNKINMRLDYGIPLVDVNSRDKTAQEEGFYFSVSTTPFSF